VGVLHPLGERPGVARTNVRREDREYLDDGRMKFIEAGVETEGIGAFELFECPADISGRGHARRVRRGEQTIIESVVEPER